MTDSTAANTTSPTLRSWLYSVLDKRQYRDPSLPLSSLLRDGVDLCVLLNKLGLADVKVNQTPSFKQRAENVSTFTTACIGLGIPKAIIFTEADIRDGREQVIVKGLEAVRSRTVSSPSSPPPMTTTTSPASSATGSKSPRAILTASSPVVAPHLHPPLARANSGENFLLSVAPPLSPSSLAATTAPGSPVATRHHSSLSGIGAAAVARRAVEVTTMADDQKVKAAFKYSPEVQEYLREWLRAVLGERPSVALACGDLVRPLKDGVLLCLLINTFVPGAVPKVYEGLVAYRQIENVSNYLKAVSTHIGLRKEDLFDVPDLFEERNPNAVIQHLQAFAHGVAKRPGCNKFPPLKDSSHVKSLFAQSLSEQAPDTVAPSGPLSKEESELVAWMSSGLSSPVNDQDVCNDLRNGVKLIKLIEQLSGGLTLVYNEQPSTLWQMMHNASQLLEFVKHHNILKESTGSISPHDIVTGNKSKIFALIRTIREHFDVDFIFTQALNETVESGPDCPKSAPGQQQQQQQPQPGAKAERASATLTLQDVAQFEEEERKFVMTLREKSGMLNPVSPKKLQSMEEIEEREARRLRYTSRKRIREERRTSGVLLALESPESPSFPAAAVSLAPSMTLVVPEPEKPKLPEELPKPAEPAKTHKTIPATQLVANLPTAASPKSPRALPPVPTRSSSKGSTTAVPPIVTALPATPMTDHTAEKSAPRPAAEIKTQAEQAIVPKPSTTTPVPCPALEVDDESSSSDSEPKSQEAAQHGVPTPEISPPSTPSTSAKHAGSSSSSSSSSEHRRHHSHRRHHREDGEKEKKKSKEKKKEKKKEKEKAADEIGSPSTPIEVVSKFTEERVAQGGGMDGQADRQRAGSAALVPFSGPRHSSWPNLEMVLEDPVLRADFRSFLESEFALENLLFYDDVMSYKRRLSDNQAALFAESKRIFEEYCTGDSENEINISWTTKQEVQTVLSKGPSAVGLSTWDKAHTEVVRLLRSDLYVRWYRSKQPPSQSPVSTPVVKPKSSSSGVSGIMGSFSDTALRILGAKETVRARIANQLLESEKSYVGHLSACFELVIEPTLKRSLLTEPEAWDVFSIVPLLLTYHRLFLTRLEDVCSHWQNHLSTVGDIFIENTQFFMLYSIYLRCYSVSLMSYRQYRITREAFEKLLGSFQETQKISVEQVLALPFQRLEAYVAILRSMQKYTSKGHRDAQLLDEALARTAKLCEAISSILDLSTIRSSRRLLSVADSIVGLEGQVLIVPGRRLLCQGPVELEVTREGGSGAVPRPSVVDGVMFLFNDLIVCCTHNPAPGDDEAPPYKLAGSIPRSDAQAAVPHVKDGRPAVLLASNSSLTWLFVGGNDKETGEWLTRLTHWSRQ